MLYATSRAPARRNALLAALPKMEREPLQRSLEPVFLASGETLYAPGVPPGHVYFPTSAVVSLVYITLDGAQAEIASIGREGLVGIATFMCGESRPNWAIVQGEGWAYRVKRHLFKAEFAGRAAMQNLLLRYTMVLLTQTAQSAICNRHHYVHQQLCRWLLQNLDRHESNDLSVTHELIARTPGGAPRGGDRGGRQAAESGRRPLQPRPHHGGRSVPSRIKLQRMLRRRKAGVRSPVTCSDSVRELRQRLLTAGDTCVRQDS